MILDLLIIGGGINGAAIAREAARGGWSVMLVERDDLAGHTSSASSKLIHGGLRYLEFYEFKLVREALHERSRLLRAAPHLIEPMPFVLPQDHAVRPWLMVRAGLLLYDLLAGRSPLPWARGLRGGDSGYRAPLRQRKSGFVYYDCKVDDARLTILNAVDAAAHGAHVALRTEMTGAVRENGIWQVSLSDGRTIAARAIANAAGPWVDQALQRTGRNSANGIRLIKGSHIAVPKLYEGEQAYLLQQPDRRVVFAIPWQGMTMIGTTDIAVDSAEAPKISDAETRYLCDAANLYFTKQISPADIVYDWSGVRPLYDDGASAAQQVTRDYVLELDPGDAPLLSVFGGKITTARHLAEVAVEKLAAALDRPFAPATRDAYFPGGDIGTSLTQFIENADARWPFLGRDRAARMAAAYGSQMTKMLDGASSAADLGEDFGAGLSAREVDWLVTHEWARSADDILWRRSRLGLDVSAADVARLEIYLAAHPAAQTGEPRTH